MEGNSYKNVIKHIQFLMNNNTCTKKQIKEIMKESEVTNNKNTH